jgi:dihydroorotate dehydrogenase (fumarate)
MNLSRNVGTLRFSNPLIYGGGTLKTLDDVRKMCRSEAAGGEIGTITPLSKAGNEGNTFYAHRKGGVLIYTLNSLGLNNPGKEAWAAWAKDALRIAHDAGKLLGINIAADTVSEIVEMVLWAIDCGFDWVTINAGCPNKWKLIGVKQVPQAILSFDTNDTERLVAALDARIGAHGTEIWWKPSPDNDTLGSQMRNADIIAQSTVITGWIANNTVPHCFAWEHENGKVAITPGGGLAGMGGPAVKPKALGDIRRLRERLPQRFSLLGAGGATYGEDILDFLKGGAAVVQFASAHWASHFDFNIPGYMLADFIEMPETETFLATI